MEERFSLFHHPHPPVSRDKACFLAVAYDNRTVSVSFVQIVAEMKKTVQK